MINYEVNCIILFVIVITQFLVMFFFFFKVREGRTNNIEDETKFLDNKHIRILGDEVLHSNEGKLILLLSPECPACKEVLNSFKLFNERILTNLVIIYVNSEKKKGIQTDDLIKSYELDEDVVKNELRIKSFPYAILIKKNKIIKADNIYINSLIKYISEIEE